MNTKRRDNLFLILSASLTAGVFLYSFLQWNLLFVPATKFVPNVWTMSFEDLAALPAWPLMLNISEFLAASPFVLFSLFLALFLIGLSGFERVADFSGCSSAFISIGTVLLAFMGLEELYPTECILDFAILPWFLLFVLRNEERLSKRALILLAAWSCLGAEAWLALAIFFCVLLQRLWEQRRSLRRAEIESFLAALALVLIPPLVILGEPFFLPLAGLCTESVAISLKLLGLTSPDFHLLKIPLVFALLALVSIPLGKRSANISGVLLLGFSLLLALYFQRYLWVFCFFAILFFSFQLSAERTKTVNQLTRDLVAGIIGITLLLLMYLNPTDISVKPDGLLEPALARYSEANIERPFVVTDAAKLAVGYDVPSFIKHRPYLSLLRSNTKGRKVAEDYQKILWLEEGWTEVMERRKIDAVLLRSNMMLRRMLLEQLSWKEIASARWRDEEWSLILPVE